MELQSLKTPFCARALPGPMQTSNGNLGWHCHLGTARNSRGSRIILANRNTHTRDFGGLMDLTLCSSSGGSEVRLQSGSQQQRRKVLMDSRGVSGASLLWGPFLPQYFSFHIKRVKYRLHQYRLSR